MKISNYPILFFIFIIFSGCPFQKKNNESAIILESNQKLSEILKNKISDTILISPVLRQAFDIAQKYSYKTHDSLTAATCRQMGNVFFDKQQYEVAYQYYKKGLGYGKKHLVASDEIIARLYHNIGLAYFNLDDYKTALKYFDSIKVESLEKPLQILKTNKLQRSATCYYYLKDYKSSERLFEEAIPMAQSNLTIQNLVFIYKNYANCLRRSKKYQLSIDASQKSIYILDTLSKSKFQKLNKNDSFNLAGGYFGVAYALQDSGAYLSAEMYYNQALILFKKINDIDNYSGGLLNMGLMFRYNKALKKAEKTLTDGIQLLNQQAMLSDFLWVRKGMFYINRSEVFFEKRQYQKALVDQDSAIYYLTKYDKSSSLNALLLSSRYSLLSVYSDRAKINMLLAENGSDTEGYQNALKLMQQIIELTDDIRADYFSDDAKLTLANDIKPALEKAINVCQKLYIKTKDKQYLEQAFGFVEYSRSMVLYENARLDNQLSDDLKKENERLKEYERDLISKNNVEKLQNYLRLKRQFREKIKILNRNQLAPISTLQSALIKTDTMALIEFFVGDSSIFVFALIKNDLKLIELNKSKDFEKQINDLRQSITQRHPMRHSEGFETQSKAVYSYLLNPIMTQLNPAIKQLIIVPDGILNYLPFDILIKNDPSVNVGFGMSDVGVGNASFKKSRFLVRDYTISYAYSANLLLEQKRPKKEKASELFAGFAAKYEDKDTLFPIADVSRAVLTRDGAYQLKGAKEEVNLISDLIGGKAFVNESATEGNFKREANRYKILHFAMHSLTDDKDPALSRLLFTLTPKDSTNDNDLTAAELYTTSLKAELAVLSACNTGFGTLSKGEGVMSLARAFTYAGVPSTVTSLWKVPDIETSDIMVDFYKNLKNGMSKDAALRAAKLTYLDKSPESIAANPYFWAGFVTMGNMEAMDFSENRPLSIWGVLVGVLGVFAIVFWLKRRKNHSI